MDQTINVLAFFYMREAYKQSKIEALRKIQHVRDNPDSEIEYDRKELSQCYEDTANTLIQAQITISQFDKNNKEFADLKSLL